MPLKDLQSKNFEKGYEAMANAIEKITKERDAQVAAGENWQDPLKTLADKSEEGGTTLYPHEMPEESRLARLQPM